MSDGRMHAASERSQPAARVSPHLQSANLFGMAAVIAPPYRAHSMFHVCGLSGPASGAAAERRREDTVAALMEGADRGKDIATEGEEAG